MKVPEIMLERFVLNELPADVALRIDEAMKHDRALRERAKALAELQSASNSRWIAESIRQRLHQEPSSSGSILWWAMPAVATVILAAIVTRPGDSQSAGIPMEERIKGPEAALSIYRKTPSGSEQLDEGAVAHQGDVIRIGYRLSDTAFGMIASVDGRGVVTLHHPAATPRAARLRGGEVVLLDQAYELDDAPKWERFYIITGTTEFEVAPVVEAISRLAAASNGAAPLPLSSTLNQATFQLQKETRP